MESCGGWGGRKGNFNTITDMTVLYLCDKTELGHTFLYLCVHLGAPSTLVLWNAMKRATKWGSERSSQLEFIAHLGSLYNYNRVDIYILVYDYREGFQVGL